MDRSLPPSDEPNDDVFKELGELSKKYFFDTAKTEVKHPRFFHMFKDLATNGKCLIPQTEETLNNLSKLGTTMRDKEFEARLIRISMPPTPTSHSSLTTTSISLT